MIKNSRQLRVKFLILLFSFNNFSLLIAQVKNKSIYDYIEDEKVISENKQQTHATFYSYSSEENAIKKFYKNTENYQSLNGLWKFKWVRKPQDRPIDFYKTNYNTEHWTSIKVPGNWEVEGFGIPIYTNHQYEFAHYKAPLSKEIEFVDKIIPKTPGKVPHDYNPVGSYKREFNLKKSWKDKEVFLHLGAVKSGVFVWINGIYVGYSQGSKLPAEFNITKQLKRGKNSIALQIYRWTDGSYIECQDFWRISGIEREVYLYAQPKVRIKDFDIISSLDGTYKNGVLDFLVDFQNHNKQSQLIKVSYKLFDNSDRVISTQSKNLRINGKQISSINFSDTISRVKSWSGEHPNLYKLVITVKKNNEVLEVIASQVGFRTVEIKNGLLLINNQRITLKGVNTHEHNPETGHVITEEQILRDIELWKQNNINAVRLSHYPQPEMFYELCDKYGIYIVDEANIESHGMGYGKHSLAKKESWQKAHIDRMIRMVQRDKNHPSVIIWSMGNEAGNGINFYKGYDTIKSLDRSKRPIQYERTYKKSRSLLDMDKNTDLIVPQYPSPATFERIGKSKIDRPFIPSEYAHSMGNSTGNFQDFWDIIEKYDKLQGGFIWDWVDQSLWKTDQKGQRYYAYGGDFGKNMPSDNSFLNNGVVFPDRTPQPALHEVKKAHEFINFKKQAILKDELVLNIENLYHFTDLNQFDFTARIKANGTVLKKLNLEDIHLKPGANKQVKIPLNDIDFVDNTEYFIELSALTKNTWGMLNKGYVVANEQIRLDEKIKWLSAKKNHIYQNIQTEQKEDTIVFFNKDFRVSFHKTQGKIISYQYLGKELIKKGNGPKPNFWRAPTDNDIGNKMHLRNIQWKNASINSEVSSFIVKNNKPVIDVTIAYQLAGVNTSYISSYSLYPSGLIKVSNTLNKSDYPADIPRIGMRLQLAKKYDKLSYYGRGPWENYNDRNTSAFVAVYNQTVKEQYVPYIRPQENAYKTEVRWLALQDSENNGLLFVASKNNPKAISFSALHMPNEDFYITDGLNYKLNNAEVNMSKHTVDIVEKNLVQLNIDLAQRGLGGDNSWQALPQEKYMLKSDKAHSYTFYMMPFTKGSVEFFTQSFQKYFAE
ncbi:MAG: glycoside hydrolase family 2 TIM barrel-domain containing protein [Tenacibaculum sp.]